MFEIGKGALNVGEFFTFTDEDEPSAIRAASSDTNSNIGVWNYPTSQGQGRDWKRSDIIILNEIDSSCFMWGN